MGSGLSRPPPITTASIDAGQQLSKFRNDRGVPEIRIGVSEFKCIGISPPQDHPHFYINMSEADTILCPHCATRFRFDPRLIPSRRGILVTKLTSRLMKKLTSNQIKHKLFGFLANQLHRYSV
jgi:uncharacterized Zn-finger protein